MMDVTELMMPPSMTISARLRSTMTSSPSDDKSSESPAKHAARQIHPPTNSMLLASLELCWHVAEQARARAGTQGSP